MDSRDQWCREGEEGEEEVLRYRTRVAVLGKSLVREGEVDDVVIR